MIQAILMASLIMTDIFTDLHLRRHGKKFLFLKVSGGAARDTISYIEDCIAQLRPINLSLRLVCFPIV